MDNSKTTSHSQYTFYGLRRPLIPARIVRLGAEMTRKQAVGSPVVFRAVKVETEWRGVYSRLDGYESTWHSIRREWVPVANLQPGQLELKRGV